MSTPRRRAVAVLLAGLLPLTILLDGSDTSFVFAFGLVSTDPFHVVPIDDYLFVHTRGLPRRLEAWPAGVLLHACALACAVWNSSTDGGGDGHASTNGSGDDRSVPIRVDPRLTGGLLVVAGLLHAQVSLGLYRSYGPGGPLVLPLGAAASWAVAWWYYWPLVRERGTMARAD